TPPRPLRRGRAAALTFVFVGGGYAGVEALEDMARDACARYPEISRGEMRWVLVEAAGQILPEAGEGMGGGWALGDGAAVPDLAKGLGALCAPSAQHAYRQPRRLAGNIAAVLRGGKPAPYRHASAGSGASLG